MEIPSNEQQWIEAFFSTPNTLVWDDLISGDVEDLLRDEVHGWLQLLGNAQVDSPVLVPRISPEGTTWFACSHNDRMNAQAGEELEALVAHAYASVERYPTLDLTDSSDNALLERFGKHICRIDVALGKEKSVLRMLGIYRQLVERRPERPKIGMRPSGKIRNIFDKALLAGNFGEARNCIDELKESGRLDLQNQRFLEIRLLAVQEKWQAIVGDPTYLQAVADLALPARILSDLVEAIYQVYLLKHEDSADSQSAITAFKELVKPKFGRLFRARKGIKTPSVLKTFLIEQISSESPEQSVCQKLIDEYPISDPGFAYVQNLRHSVPQKPVAKDLVERAKEAFFDDKIELALELYASCPSDKDVLEKVLRCSRDVESQTDLEVAWAYCQDCPEGWLEGLPPKQIKSYNALKETFMTQPISNWIDWVNFVLEGGNLNEAESLAQNEATKWSTDDLTSNSDRMELFCNLLTEGVLENVDFFQRQFSHIYEFSSSPQEPIIQFRPLYIVLLELLTLADAACESDLILAQELVRSLFEVGIPAEKYERLLDDVNKLWSSAKSVKHLDWAMDVAELMATNPSPKPELRLNFFINILGVVEANSHRVDKSTWLVLDILAKDFDAIEYVGQIKPTEDAVDETTTENPLAGKKVGIYSLTEPAAIRAKQLLETMCPGVNVVVNHDHEETEALSNLAKSADFFIFAWRSSKHQAFYCVKKYIQADRLLLPPGKGSTSIVNCLLERVSFL